MNIESQFPGAEIITLELVFCSKAILNMELSRSFHPRYHSAVGEKNKINQQSNIPHLRRCSCCEDAKETLYHNNLTKTFEKKGLLQTESENYIQSARELLKMKR